MRTAKIDAFDVRMLPKTLSEEFRKKKILIGDASAFAVHSMNSYYDYYEDSFGSGWPDFSSRARNL